MALSYSTIGAADQDTAFVTRVKAALLNAASAVSSEAANTANHVQRFALAGRIRNDPTGYATRMSLSVASIAPVLNATTLSAALDSEIQTGVNSLLDGYALQGI